MPLLIFNCLVLQLVLLKELVIERGLLDVFLLQKKGTGLSKLLSEKVYLFFEVVVLLVTARALF